MYFGSGHVRCLTRWLASRRGNAAVIFALSLLPLVYLIGLGSDFQLAVARQEQLNAIANSASLAGVTPAMMTSNDAASVNSATNAFNAQSSSVNGVSNVTVNVATADTINTRTITVKYSALSQNAFPGVLRSNTIAISGTSQAIANLAPNIDFYLMVDNSPSMAIAATQNDINTMVSNTSAQGGCAFGCHETHPSGENPSLGNPNNEDNYQLARNLGVTLRIDLVRTAVQDLTNTATTVEQQNNVNYRMALYTFDTELNTIESLTSTLGSVNTAAGNINLLPVYDNNYLTSGNKNNDTDTDFDTSATAINTIMP